MGAAPAHAHRQQGPALWALWRQRAHRTARNGVPGRIPSAGQRQRGHRRLQPRVHATHGEQRADTSAFPHNEAAFFGRRLQFARRRRLHTARTGHLAPGPRRQRPVGRLRRQRRQDDRAVRGRRQARGVRRERPVPGGRARSGAAASAATPPRRLHARSDRDPTTARPPRARRPII